MFTRFMLFACITTIMGAGPAVGAQDSYVGAKKCRPCHLKEYTTWEKTKMASAFELLKPGARAKEKTAAGLSSTTDYTSDAKCLACHTTGYLQPGGFKSLADTPDLVGIQCESCHGPGSGYLAKDKMSLQNKEYKRADVVAAGLVVPTADTCTSGCHTAKSPFFKKSEAFDFEKRKKEGTHEHIPLKYPH